MPSAKSDFFARGSLARRVALGAALSAALGAILAAAVCIVAIDRVLESQVDQRLRAACEILAGELREEAEEGDGSFQEVLDDENGELVHSGIRLAVYQGRELVAGDAWVPKASGQRCVSRGEIGKRIRACGADYNGYRLVAGQQQDDGAVSMAYLVAGILAALIAGLLGALGSAVSVRWTLRPLSTFVMLVRRLNGSNPDPAAVGEPLPVTELEALRRALQESLARTREHLSHIERFSAEVAHELLTPLAILRADLDLLGEDSASDARIRIERLAERTGEVSELVRRLLLLSTPSELDTDSSFVSLASIVVEVKASLTDERRARVEFDEAAEGLLRGDETLLRSLVQNAIDNALKHSKSAVRVRVVEGSSESTSANQNAHSSPRVSLDVIDDGPGIPKELRHVAFEPFQRLQSSAHGHGLGLALIRRIAQAHGGTATLLDVARGTHLQVILPGVDGES